jgi:hypothetical protein
MHPSMCLSVTCLVLLAAGCAQGGSNHGGGTARVGTKTALDCAQFLVAGSPFAAEVAANGLEPACEKTIGPQGGYVEAFGLAGAKVTNEGDGTGPVDPGAISLMLIYRYYGWNEAMAPMKPSDLSDASNFRYLPDKIPLQLEGAEGMGSVSTFELAGLPTANACVSANTVNANGSRSRIEMCRAVPKPADDAEVLAMAKTIDNEDFKFIKP